MTTLATLRSEVYSSIGGRTDSDAQMWADRGINAGILSYCFINEPPEARTTGQGTATVGGGFITITDSLIRPVRLERVYNSSGAVPVLPIPEFLWDILWFPTTGPVKYYCMHGNILYYKPLPSGDETLDFFYFQYPVRLSVETESYPYSTGEDFVLAFAKKWAWACQEEMDDSSMWNGIADALLIPEVMITKLRRFVREEWGYGNDLQRAV